jgi:hypothetical protein
LYFCFLTEETKYFQKPVEIFVKKQMALMKKGLSEEEAFQICVKEKEMEADALNLEKELLKQQVIFNPFIRCVFCEMNHNFLRFQLIE